MNIVLQTRPKNFIPEVAKDIIYGYVIDLKVLGKITPLIKYVNYKLKQVETKSTLEGEQLVDRSDLGLRVEFLRATFKSLISSMHIDMQANYYFGVLSGTLPFFSMVASLYFNRWDSEVYDRWSEELNALGEMRTESRSDVATKWEQDDDPEFAATTLAMPLEWFCPRPLKDELCFKSDIKFLFKYINTNDKRLDSEYVDRDKRIKSLARIHEKARSRKDENFVSKSCHLLKKMNMLVDIIGSRH